MLDKKARDFDHSVHFCTQELLCQFRSTIMKLQDDIRISGGARSQGTGDNQARALELKDQMTQLTQENVTIFITFNYCCR